MVLDTTAVEPNFVTDTWADGIAVLEVCGPDGSSFRTVYFSWQRIPGTNTFERVVVAKVVRPKASILNPDGPFAAQLERSQKAGEPALLTHESAH